MTKITIEKTHSLLEKLTNYVMNEVPKKSETDKLVDYVMNELPTRREVDGKIDKLAEYVMNKVPRKDEVPSKAEFQYLAGKVDSLKDKVNTIEGKTDALGEKVDTLLDGMDRQAQQLEIIRTEQTAFNHGFNRLEKRVKKLEKVH
jgi:polyhydroxyalkanoate synthesis regulator phasin